MKRKLLLVLSTAFLFSCTMETKDKHIFHYSITGNSVKATNLYGKMGPGISFDSPTIDIPFEVSHEVYGSTLDYELSISDKDTSHHYSVKIYIDDQLIKESTSYDFLHSETPSVIAKGTFQQ